MDPVGPWSAYAASYNRLAGATGSFQASSASGGGDFVTSHHLATGNTGLGSHQPVGSGVPSTSSQLLLQAAHTTATLAGQLGQLSGAAPGANPSPFAAGGFLNPASVGYDSVFSPLFHHANPKPAHYSSTLNVSQHRQALAQAQAAVNKVNSIDSELTSLRENYSTAHQNIAAAAAVAAASGNSFFDHQASTVPWSHQGNAQLPSPFGILPHETVASSSPGTSTSKSSSYESSFNSHFVATQNVNNLNPSLVADFNKSSSNYIEHSGKKSSRSLSPQVSPLKTLASSVSVANTFYSQSSTPAYANSDSVAMARGSCPPISRNFSNKSLLNSSSSEFTPNTKSYPATSSLQQPSCIVSTTTSTLTGRKDYRIPQPSSRASNAPIFLSSSTPSTKPQQAAEKLPSRTQSFVSVTSKANLSHGIQTKAQTKIYPEVGAADHAHRSDNVHESSQSSPISFAVIDSSVHRTGLNYPNIPSASSCGTASNSSKLSSSRSLNSNIQGTQQFQHILGSQTPTVTAAPTNTSYPSRLYSGHVGSETSSEYQSSSRNIKLSSAADPSFSDRIISSSHASSQSSPDCDVPRRQSPHQPHSQPSPLRHVSSPGYPVYNSPIASMSSPSSIHHSDNTGNQCQNGSVRPHNSNPSSQQPTSASPLDVSVSRSSTQSSQVAYSSVITANYSASNSIGVNAPLQNLSSSQVRGASIITERQSAFFDSNSGQVKLQDLSNCRGDPMSVVKNLQTSNQPCLIPQSTSLSVQIKSEETANKSNNGNNSSRTRSGNSNKRRKSGEKNNTNVANSNSNASTSEFYTRVPPPAHHNSHTSNQQSQNGTFLDFERWSLPHPPSKIFHGGPGSFSSQASLQHSSSFVNSASQHSPIVMSSPHSSSTSLTYYPVYPVQPPGHNPNQPPPNELQVSVTISQRANSGNQAANANSNCPVPQVQEELPKVIVPNIEEELEFLSEIYDPITSTANQRTATSLVKSTLKPSETSANIKMEETNLNPYSNPATGFMASYLKFLQGERNSAPPQTKRNKSKPKLYKPQELQKTSNNVSTTLNSNITNNIISNITSVSSSSLTTSTTANGSKSSADNVNFELTDPLACDPEDDPRYFPLKKERKGSFSDSDDFCGSPKRKVSNKENVLNTEKETGENKDLEKDKDKSKSKSSHKVCGKTPSSTQIDLNSKVDPSVQFVNDVSLNDSECSGSLTEKSDKNSLPKIKDVIIPLTRLPDDVSKSVDVTKSVHATKSVDATKSADETNSVDVTKSVDVIKSINVTKRVDSTEQSILEKGKKLSAKIRIGSKRKREVGKDLPRRQLSRRAAKEKTLTNLNKQVCLDEFDADEPEVLDSDSDPAWTPAKDDSDEEGCNRRRTRRSVNLLNSNKKGASNIGLRGDEAMSSSDSQDVPSKSHHQKKQSKSHQKSGRGRPSRACSSNSVTNLQNESSSTGSVSSDVSVTSAQGGRTLSEKDRSSGSDTKDSSQNAKNHGGDEVNKTEESYEIPFKSGEFVVMKSDLKDDNPPIWRIDGKTLLQKYEAFQENGKTLYRNISTYSGWAPQNKHVYQLAPVRFKLQNRMETVVEFLRDELNTADEVFEKSLKETEKYQDNFEVYIQTLISQALDSNFLHEILQEGDEYFLASVKQIDEVTEEKKKRLLKVTKWKRSVVTSVSTWPCFNVIADLKEDEFVNIKCAACEKSPVSVRVQMYGQPYNNTTLEGSPPDPEITNEKDFLICKSCFSCVQLYHKIAHQKYLMFIECSQKVAEKRSQDDSTVILNELLADETWLHNLYKSVRTSWAEIDKVAYNLKKLEK